MERKLWSGDKLMGISALFISLLTFGVLLYQANLMREQQRLSVLPYLSLVNYGTYTPHYKLILENNGVGPAIIESITISHKGKEHETDFANFFLDQIQESDSIENLYHSNIFPGRFIPSEEKISLLEIDNSLKDAVNLAEVLQRVGNEDFGFELIYKSIYGERWRISTVGGVPEKLD